MTISEYFALYTKNIKLTFELDDGLFDPLNKDEWVEKLKYRSKKLREILDINQWIISCLNEVVDQDLNDDDAALLMGECINSIIEGMSDAELQYPILLKLSTYYKNKGDLDNYLACLYYAGFVEGEILYRSGAIETIHTSLDERIISEKENYSKIQDENIRSLFLMSFNNLSVCAVTDRSYFPTSYKYLMEMEKFWASKEVQELDGNNEAFIEYMATTRRLWLQLNFDKRDKNKPEGKYYIKSCKEHFDKMYEECGDDVSKYLIQTYGPYLNSLAIQDIITYEQACEKFYVKYRDYMDQALNGRNQMEFVCYGLLPSISILSDLLNKVSDYSFKKKYYDILVSDLSKYGKKHQGETQVDSNINQALAELCISALPTVEGRENKESMLFNLVIKRQLQTYLHSMMTCKISNVIANYAWDKLPGYFDETGFINKDEFVTYVTNSALFHDLGKIKITDIVNMQRRRLGEEEFSGIKRHPSIGASIVEKDKDLCIYKDIILGHHKFYDGTFGYPITFDNTKSKFRKIIDIITLADCLDAATDTYSRNYKIAKSLKELISEFVEQSNTRYNPVLVNLIKDSDELMKSLEEITSKGRLDMMYEAYSEGKEKYI